MSIRSQKSDAVLVRQKQAIAQNKQDSSALLKT
jgi:hypothetical protein